MTYKELFKDYYAAHPFQQPGKNIQLYRFLETLAVTSQSVSMVKTLMDYKNGWKQFVHPDDLIQLLRDVGFYEWPDLEKFIQAVDASGFNFNVVIALLDPPFPDAIQTQRKHYIDIQQIFRLAGFPVVPFVAGPMDLHYELLTYSDLLRVIAACDSDKMPYIPTSRDCDDFSRIFLGWLSRKGKGNTAIFNTLCWLNYSNGTREYHSMCIAPTVEGHIYIFEPQNDKLFWRWGDSPNWPNVTHVEYARIGE